MKKKALFIRDFPPELHWAMKELAAKRRQTLTGLIIEILSAWVKTKK